MLKSSTWVSEGCRQGFRGLPDNNTRIVITVMSSNHLIHTSILCVSILFTTLLRREEWNYEYFRGICFILVIDHKIIVNYMILHVFRW